MEHCLAPLYASDEEPDLRDVVIFLGSDASGVPLEIVAIESEAGGLLVIHAMRLRRRYRDDYRQVTGQRP